MKFEAWMVGCTTGSRREVPGERKPVIRDDNNRGGVRMSSLVVGTEA